MRAGEAMPNPMRFQSTRPRWERGTIPVRRAFEPSRDRLINKLLPSRKDVPGEHADRALRCRACGKAIAYDHDRISVLGTHEHSCTNPHGIRFRIGCFCDARGGAETGEAIAEHTWFAGYRWRVMLCAQCGTHLGWGFHDQGGDRFYGLILDRLIVPH
jgi:hypothetical protein